MVSVYEHKIKKILNDICIYYTYNIYIFNIQYYELTKIYFY